jgi:hypothetical protein
MLKKLLNLGSKSKSNGFFLELKENENTQAETNVKEAKSTTSVKAKKAEPKSDETVQTKQPESKSATSVKDKKTEPKSDKTVETKQPESAQATSTQKVEGKEKQSAETKSSNAPVATAASSWEPPFWVKIMNEKTSSNSKKAESEPTFATDYLMPAPTKSRRRPGPSLDTFRSMARQAKAPRS